MASVRFSCFLNRDNLFPKLMTRGSMVSGTAKLISLLKRKRSLIFLSSVTSFNTVLALYELKECVRNLGKLNLVKLGLDLCSSQFPILPQHQQ